VRGGVVGVVYCWNDIYQVQWRNNTAIIWDNAIRDLCLKTTNVRSSPGKGLLFRARHICLVVFSRARRRRLHRLWCTNYTAITAAAGAGAAAAVAAAAAKVAAVLTGGTGQSTNVGKRGCWRGTPTTRSCGLVVVVGPLVPRWRAAAVLGASAAASATTTTVPAARTPPPRGAVVSFLSFGPWRRGTQRCGASWW